MAKKKATKKAAKKTVKKVVKKKVKKVAKKATKKAIKKVATTVASRAALGAIPIAGPALVALTTIGTQMKKGSPLSKFLNKDRSKFIGSNFKKKETPKALPKAMSPGPKKKSKLSKVSGKQKMENEKRANIRENQRGKVGPKRNVVKTSSGVLKDKSGKAVTFGKKKTGPKKVGSLFRSNR